VDSGFLVFRVRRRRRGHYRQFDVAAEVIDLVERLRNADVGAAVRLTHEAADTIVALHAALVELERLTHSDVQCSPGFWAASTTAWETARALIDADSGKR
jgi:hypothetical protein